MLVEMTSSWSSSTVGLVVSRTGKIACRQVSSDMGGTFTAMMQKASSSSPWHRHRFSKAATLQRNTLVKSHPTGYAVRSMLPTPVAKLPFSVSTTVWKNSFRDRGSPPMTTENAERS